MSEPIGSRCTQKKSTPSPSFFFGLLCSRFEPLQSPRALDWLCAPPQPRIRTYPGAKRGSESLIRQAFFFPYLIFPAGDRRRPTDLCAFFTWCARVVWAVFRFRIAKSSVFSRRRKTPEECSRPGRHDPYRVCVPFTWCAWVSMEFFKHQTVCSYPRRARRRRRAAHNR